MKTGFLDEDSWPAWERETEWFHKLKGCAHWKGQAHPLMVSSYWLRNHSRVLAHVSSDTHKPPLITHKKVKKQLTLPKHLQYAQPLPHTLSARPGHRALPPLDR